MVSLAKARRPRVMITPAGTAEIHFSAGETTGTTTLTFTPVDDDIYENDETIIVEGGDGLEVTDNASITLVDNESPPTFTLAADPAAVNENAGPTPVVVTATASGRSSMNMTLAIVPVLEQSTITIGEDAGVTGDLSITVAAGSLEGSTTITAVVIDDDIYEGDEYVVIVGQIGDMVTPPITLTIIDDEAQPTVTLSLDPEAVEEGGGAQPFTVSGEASGRSSMDLTVMLGPLPTEYGNAGRGRRRPGYHVVRHLRAGDRRQHDADGPACGRRSLRDHGIPGHWR